MIRWCRHFTRRCSPIGRDVQRGNCRHFSSHFEESKQPQQPISPAQPLGQFDGSRLNVYDTLEAPNRSQLRDAARFFTLQRPELLFSQAEFRLLPQSHHPEVTVLGRSNVGKSSLLNALFNRHGVALTSSKPGKTKLMNGFSVSPRALSAAPKSGTKGEIMAESWRRLQKGFILVDMPGYGTGSRAQWGKQINKYLDQRRQLRRAFLLVDSEHGLKATDMTILEHLYRHGIPHTVVLSKIDKLIYPGSRMPDESRLEGSIHKVRQLIATMSARLKTDVWQGRDPSTDFLCVSSLKSLDSPGQVKCKIGIDELRWAMMSACSVQEASKPSANTLGDINIID